MLIVDDNYFNIQPLNFLINEFEIDKTIIDLIKGKMANPKKVIEMI